MTSNPFDWTAQPFLDLYVLLAVSLVVLSVRARSTIGPTGRLGCRLCELELAYLAGGARRLGDAVLFTLVSGNGAIISTNGREITVTNQSPLTEPVGRRLPLLSFAPNMTRHKFQRAIGPIVERIAIRDRLQPRSQSCRGTARAEKRMGRGRRPQHEYFQSNRTEPGQRFGPAATEPLTRPHAPR